jgi:hypothetical protein
MYEFLETAEAGGDSHGGVRPGISVFTEILFYMFEFSRGFSHTAPKNQPRAHRKQRIRFGDRNFRGHRAEGATGVEAGTDGDYHEFGRRT